MNQYRIKSDERETMRGTEMSFKRKSGIVDRILEKLPEIHIRGYSYCGPNTNLKSRLARGEQGINELDHACLEHDIAYTSSSDLKSRCKADKILALKAIRRIFAKDSRFGERCAAILVSWLISLKMLLGKTELYIINLRKCLFSNSKTNSTERIVNL